MDKTVLISLPIEDLQTVIIDCVTSCLKNNKQYLNEQSLNSDRWLDLTELRNYLPDKPSKATVYSWKQKGSLPCHKGAKKLRFLKSEIDEWLKQGKKYPLNTTSIEPESYLLNRKKKG